MRVAIFGTKSYDRQFLDAANETRHEFIYYEPTLSPQTAGLARDSQAVCVFVNDQVDRETIGKLKEEGVKLIALRCAGFNNVDLKAAEEAGIKVVRVPAYSPYAVAEHAMAMILTLNRKTHRAYNRVRENNFSLEKLLGFDLHGKTVGVIGTGKIGQIFCRILIGFGCRVLAYDLYPSQPLQQAGVEYVALDELFPASDIISLQCPLTPETYHIINQKTVGQMKKGAMLINTSRGGLLDTQAVIDGLKSGKIGYLGIDVYEQEEALFFQDLSDQVIQDDQISRLMTFPNVLITAHQAFFTDTALRNIAETTLKSLDEFEQGQALSYTVSTDKLKK